MKKTIFIRVVTPLSMLVISLASYGQATVTGLRFSNPAVPAGDTISKTAAHASNRDDINSKAMKNFGRSFKKVFNEKWYEIDDALIATFTLDDISYRVDYCKKATGFGLSGPMMKQEWRVI